MREEGTLFQPGQLVANGHFRVLRLLGSGATSHVYAAEPAANPGARVALKVLRRSFAHHSIALRRFQREAAVVQLVKSRFVARFLGAGLDEAKCIWMAFELFEGDSLERLLPQGRCDLLQGSDDIRWVVRDVLQGLDAAHKAQIVHRDIKPSNIFIRSCSDGTRRAMILDFGISKLLEPPKGGAPSALTVVGTTIGTPDYMPPEQNRSAADVDHRVDTYALGVVAFQVLTGRLPYEGRSVSDRIDWKHDNDPLTLEAATGQQWPLKLQEFLGRTMARDPAGRWPSAAAMLDAWCQVLSAIESVSLPCYRQDARIEVGATETGPFGSPAD